MAILTQTIPNMPAPLEDILRAVKIVGIIIEDDINGNPFLILRHRISYDKSGVDISGAMDKGIRTVEINNSKLMLVRDENFQPIPNPEYATAVAGNQLSPTLPNPEYVDEETTPEAQPTIPNPDYVSDEQLAQISEYLVAPGYDYLLGEQGVLRLHPELTWIILGKYILENTEDGYFETL